MPGGAERRPGEEPGRILPGRMAAEARGIMDASADLIMESKFEIAAKFCQTKLKIDTS